MPTASTARLLAKKRQRQHEKKNDIDCDSYSIPLYVPATRRVRPKSCKYDSYRLRARGSHVEENLFGEPFKNKIIRSRSMEAISAAAMAATGCEENQDSGSGYASGPGAHQKLFVVREEKRPRHIPERPKTALATMRAGNRLEPEFDRNLVRKSGDRVKSDFSTAPQPLILSRREFEKILRASKVVSPSERAAQYRRQQEEAEAAAAKASEEKKAFLEASAVMRESSPDASAAEREEQNHHILERAQMLADESLPEVKRLNAWINEVKCQAIRDLQKMEKEKKLEEMAEADRHLEEEMESERRRAIQMAEDRAARLAEFHQDYRSGLKEQKEEMEALRLLDEEIRAEEMRIRRKQEEEEKEAKAREREQKRLKAALLKEQMAEELEKTRRRKEENLRAQKEEEDRILALQSARRKAEVEREERMREKKKESEAAKVQIKGQIEMEQEAKRRREAIKLLRQQEAQDRKWREKKLASERARALREEEVRQARAEQVRHRVEAAKREAEEESQFWQKTKELWMRENEKEELERLKVAQTRRAYLQDLQRQMEANALKHTAGHDVATVDNSAHQERLDRIRERKLQQLRAYNVPDKYLKEIEKKCHQAAKTRFSAAYFGKK